MICPIGPLVFFGGAAPSSRNKKNEPKKDGKSVMSEKGHAALKREGLKISVFICKNNFGHQA
jgi:hypothetical protein